MTWRCRQCGRLFVEDPGPVHLIYRVVRLTMMLLGGSPQVPKHLDTLDCGPIEEVPDAA